MLTDFKGRNTKVEALLHQLRNYFANIGTCFESSSSCFKLLEEADEHKVLMTENWEAMRQPPRQLYAKLWFTIRNLSPLLDNLEQGQCRKTAVKFFFEARYFLTVLEHYFDTAYIYAGSEPAAKEALCSRYPRESYYLADKLNELKLPAVMTIDNSDKRIAQAVIDASNRKDVKILSLNSMQSQTMKQIEDGESYFGVMYENLEAIREALN